MASVPGPPPFLRLADHALRWQLLTELAASDLRVRELVDRLEEPQSLVSYHLRLLREGGLVTAHRSSHDGRDTYYHLDLDRCADGLAATGLALHPALGAGSRRRHRAAPPARVLFVCTGNSVRSPIAEALLRHHTGGQVVVASAGISPRRHLHPHAVRVLRERYGIDVHDQVPRAVAEVAGPGPDAGFDRVVTLCDRARELLPARDGWLRTHWSVPDPAGAGVRARYADVAAAATDIDTRIRHVVPTLDNGRQDP